MNSIVKKDLLSDALTTVQRFDVFKPEDIHFLMEKKEHLGKVMLNVHQWRTDSQKESIICDQYCPTLHSKFHQAINEQRVQFDQALYLAKDIEMKKLDIEELEDEIETLKSCSANKKKIQAKKKELELSFKHYELKQMVISLDYRMLEVKGWQKIEERLMIQMIAEGTEEETIWDKSKGEIEYSFFQFLTNLQGIRSTTDGAERNNLIALAMFGVKQAKDAGVFQDLLKRCNPAQMNSLEMLGEVKKVDPQVK
jgi:hypothetical protein